MNQWIDALFFLAALLLIGFIFYRINRKLAKGMLEGNKVLDDGQVWLRRLPAVEAVVLSSKSTLRADAHGIAKVDLELKIHTADGTPIQAKTCWLVEVSSLSEVDVGKAVMVKFDPREPEHVYPAVPWARAWLF